jgi:hypothetical protein
MIVLGTAGAAALVVLGIVDGSIFRDSPSQSGGSDLRAAP